MTDWQTLEEVGVPDSDRVLVLRHADEIMQGARKNVYEIWFRVDRENYSQHLSILEHEHRWSLAFWGPPSARERAYEAFNEQLEELGINQRVKP